LLIGLDQFPQMRGLAASCQAFAMVLLAGLITQLAPTFGGRALCFGARARHAVHGRFRFVARHDPLLRMESIARCIAT
jgi:hypothetical protein